MKIKFIFPFFGLIYILLPKNGTAQKLSLKPVWGNDKFQIEKKYYLPTQNDSIQISLCKFYLSEIELYQKGNLVYKEEKSFHLLNLNDSLSCSFVIKGKDIQFDEIRMNIGIDSSTNVSGIMGGDLDPVNGMYWTWQSGYINFKIEGKSSHSKNKTGSFSYHLGGYAEPHLCMQKISLKTNSIADININFDVAKFVSMLPIQTKSEIMSPSEMAVELSKQLATCFK
ncbi:MAG: MbnP family protein [Bacteroidia bacterium]